MAKKTALLLPATADLLQSLGERLRLIRLRRRLPAKQVAERAGMSPMTLRSLERGGSGVTMGAYLAVMQVLGVEQDLDLLGKADPVGRELQDARLPSHPKTERPRLVSPAKPVTTVGRPVVDTAKISRRAKESAHQEQRSRIDLPLKRIKAHRPTDGTRDWIKKSGFASADLLATLIDLAPPEKKKVR